MSLVDRILDWELVDPRAPEPLGALIVEAVDTTVDHPVVLEGRERFRPDAPGPAFSRTVASGAAEPIVERGSGWASISWTTSVPNVPVAVARATVFDGLDSVRLTISIDKVERTAIEGVYVAFPFAIAEPVFWLETAGAVYRAEIDQLPETCRDWYSIQHAAGITDGRRSVLWTTEEAPLVQLGAIHTGAWAHHLEAPAGHLYSWLMNNLYFTNFKASQGGVMAFTYGISARAGAIDADAVRRAGELVALPLTGRLEAGQAGTKASWLRVESPDVVAVTLELDPDGRSVRVRLQASAAGAESSRLIWSGAEPLAAWRADVFGNRGARLEGDGRRFALSLAAGELATIVLEPRGTSSVDA